jgi:putative flavoprotein involved in K+ transport
LTVRVDTLVIGGGQAGLAVSRHLAAAGREHLVVERGRVAESWRARVWDSFRLVTPNWTVQLPGLAYDGPDPDGFMGRDELVAHLDRYAVASGPPLRTGAPVERIGPGRGEGLAAVTADGVVEARNVVLAVGGLHAPRLPSFAPDVPPAVLQLHSSEYRNPDGLPAGAVLVVGAGQSGAQIAEELHRSGRRVYLSVGRCRRGPRRYRGHDIVWWLDRMGAFDQVVTDRARRSAPQHNLQLSGRDGGRALDLRRFAADGVVLLGRLGGGAGGRLRVAPDLEDNLRGADAAAARITRAIDAFVARTGLPADEADEADEPGPEGEAPPDIGEPVRELDLRAAGVGTLVWATGYRPDFRWVDLPVIGEDGYPDHTRGVTPYPGLYVLGLPYLHTVKSDLLLGVGADAAHVAGHIVARR